jgi:uncharacterized RDD family membrane protein YckC
MEILDEGLTGREHNYAGFWIRFAAYFIDGIILMFVQVLISLIITQSFSFTDRPLSVTIISTVIGILYFVMLESSEKQATVGKMAVGIKVGRSADGTRITFVNALGRYFAKIISAVILLIGFMMAGWDKRKQALHDKIAQTIVYYA